MKSIFASLVFGILSIIPVPAQAAVQYIVTDLGTLGGKSSQANCINDLGQIVGYADTTVLGQSHAFRTAPNQPINPSTDDLGSLGGNCSQANSINNYGQVVGVSMGNISPWYAFRTAPNQSINPSTDNLCSIGNSYANCINDNGQVAGDIYSGSTFRGFRTAPNMPLAPATDYLGTLGGISTEPFFVNNNGQVVGWSNTTNGGQHAFRTAANQSINPSTDDLGTLGGSTSWAYDINDSGQTVGAASNNSGVMHAFRTSANQSINPLTDDLGTFGGASYGFGVNNLGQVVGKVTYGNSSHAFFYSGIEPMQDLNNLIAPDSGWTLNMAKSINNLGQIVGTGTIGGNQHAFLLTPVPEPTSLALLGMGGIGLIAYSWRRRNSHRIVVCFIALLASTAGMARADVFNMGGTRNPTSGTWTGQASLEFVTVGDPGNARDTAVMFTDYTTGYGAVSYSYAIGKYDVTVGQYCQFLNAVAKTDTYGLYNSRMATDLPTVKIMRSGGPGTFSYSVTGSYSQAVNCPVFDVSWGDAARFCNWLHNGQPSGEQGSGTTETGAYTLNGASSVSSLLAVTRNAGAAYFLPSENEWYKAAYYKGGSANAGYWKYATRSNARPSNELSATGTNNANYNIYDYGTDTDHYTDSINYLTPVGAFSASPGPYGTYDMSGDVFQWNESLPFSSARGVRGNSYDDISSMDLMSSSARGGYDPTADAHFIGFRVAGVPEPGSLAMLLSITIGGLIFWRRRKA